MNGEQIAQHAPSLGAAQLIGLAFHALSAKSLRWVTLLMAFVLFGAAVWWPDWRRLAAAGAFAVLVMFPVWLRKESANG